MRIGLDTCFLVAYEAADHEKNTASKALFEQRLFNGDDFALAPQVLAEFVHILTDQRRFDPALTTVEALERVELWWNAPEVTQVFPTDITVSTFAGWMRKHGLGRKRILLARKNHTKFDRLPEEFG